MEKHTLLEIILATIGGLLLAIGLCMCLLPQWNMFTIGVIISLLGFLLLLCIIPVYQKSHIQQTAKPINWSFLFVWIIGIVGALVMGFGMSKIMASDVSRMDMIIGMGFGIIGLVACILNYPIYTYLKKKIE